VNAHDRASFAIGDFRARASARLARDLPASAHDLSVIPAGGDHRLNAHAPPPRPASRLAAVLVPIVDRPAGASVLLTLRASHLRQHSGQIAFPGGSVDPGETPLQAALREGREEIGLDPALVEPIGWLEPYQTGTGFRILPLVAILDPAFTLNINASEVEDAFEAPLSFLMTPDNHQRQSREWQGIMRSFYAMPYEGRNIWGATAGILRALYERLYG